MSNHIPPPSERSIAGVVEHIRYCYRMAREYHDNLKAAVNLVQPHIADIQSNCQAWLLNDHYRLGYEQALKRLVPHDAERLIREAKKGAT